MARKKAATGFSMDNIVDTIIQENIDDNVDVKVNDNDVINDNANTNDNTDIVSKLKENDEPEKQRVQLYLDKDVNNLLDYYGKKVGKANGGKSKFTTEILKRFLMENQLWIEKVAKRK